MRARQFLRESDKRSTIEKLKALIEHPSTLDTVRLVAQEKLRLLTKPEPDIESDSSNETIKKPSVNLPDGYLDRIFCSWSGSTTCRQIYKNLAQLVPMPSDIAFMRQGQIHLLVPPPYQGLTKGQFSEALRTAVPGARQISCKFVEDKGYHFVIS